YPVSEYEAHLDRKTEDDEDEDDRKLTHSFTIT
ncbi:unnamed protein product, partial [Didymodactylos carnosus]